MRDVLFRLPENGKTGLQTQIREMLVGAILDGHLPPGSPLPSGRRLAQQLQVARNTVVMAYQQLVDEGYLVSRERSGYYVDEDVLSGRVTLTSKTDDAVNTPGERVNWSNLIKTRYAESLYTQKPQDWRKYKYPFVYGQFDPSLFPINDWRECSRGAISLSSIFDWAGDRIDRDDPLLIEQIVTRLLPRRGVFVSSDQVLVTLGAQHALYLISQLLVQNNTQVGMEDPGYPDARNALTSRGTLNPIPIDEQGLVVDERVGQCDLVYVTPSHQHPTTVTMSMPRRKELLTIAAENNIVIIEDDYESETNYTGEPAPALKSLDKTERVVYIGSLSKTLAPGLRLGFLVASRELINEARALRRIMLRHPPANNQHIVAQFIKRGHQDSLVRRLSHAYKQRWEILNRALSEHMPNASNAPTFGGTSFWVKAPDQIDTRELLKEAMQHDLLLEPGDVFFHKPGKHRNFMRLGFSSIANERIEPGIELLFRLINKK